jgi:hypothetical protein
MIVKPSTKTLIRAPEWPHGRGGHAVRLRTHASAITLVAHSSWAGARGCREAVRTSGRKLYSPARAAHKGQQKHGAETRMPWMTVQSSRS